MTFSEKVSGTLRQSFPVLGLLLALASLTFGLYRATDLGKQIQAERARAIVNNCRDVNRRHDATIRTLNHLIATAPPSRKRRAVESRAGTVLLINALAPKRDCAQLASKYVSGP